MKEENQTYTVSTKKPIIPEGYRKIKLTVCGYKPSVLGKTIEYHSPVWAERRYDKNAFFAEDKIYYILYTYTPIQYCSR